MFFLHFILTFLQNYGTIYRGDEMRELFAQYVNAEGMIFKHARGRSVEEGKEFPVECQFCDEKYIFTPKDIQKLLTQLDEV